MDASAGRPTSQYLFWLLRLLIVGAVAVGAGQISLSRISNESGRTPQSPEPARAVTTEHVVHFSPWCDQGCLSLVGWGSLVSDGSLLAALIVAYHYYPEWRPFAQVAVLRGTRFDFQPLPAVIGGQFSPAENRISINADLAPEPTSVLAATLAHEVYHAAADTMVDAAGCFEEEMAAFAWEAAMWEHARLGNETSSGARSHDALNQMWRNRGLQTHVLTSPIYQQECLGKVLSAY